MVIKYVLPSIQHDLAGFRALASIWSQLETCEFESIEFDMSGVNWIDGDMCAALGALMYCIGANFNTVAVTNVPDKLLKPLQRNGFLSTYGRARIPDNWGTSIPYLRIDAKDDRFFASYVEDVIVLRDGMPTMSPMLLKRFRESILEVFSNAVMHSSSSVKSP